MGKRNRRLVLKKSIKRITVYLLSLLMMASILSTGAFASKAENNNGEALESSQQLLSDSGVKEEAAENNEEGSEKELSKEAEEGEEGTQQPNEEAVVPETEELDNLEPGEEPQEETMPLTPEAEKPKGNTEEAEEVQPGGIVPYANGDILTTADTSELLQINLFDYTIRLNDRTNESRGDDLGINAGKALKFAPGGIGNQGSGFNAFTGNATTVQGIVEGTLDSNAYPRLNRSKTNSNQSLSYLFNPSEPVNGKDAYPGMNKLFLYNGNSRNYYFDSRIHYARANTSNRTFTVTEYTNSPGFFPFDNYSSNLNKDPGRVNHYFGLHVKGQFLQPAGGQITKTDGSKENMIFNFTGDDDLWVFIDGVLILDLGGIHSASSGYIDFATGIVHVNNNGNNSISSNIKRLYEAATGRSFEGNGNTYKDNTLHSIDIFYLERGNYDSNLRIDFNLDLVRTGDILIGKEIEAENGSTLNESVDITKDYTFTLYKKVTGASGAGTPQANTPYILRAVSGDVAKITSNDGSFTLKPGEYALFSKMDLDFSYYVEESGLSNLDYQKAIFTLNNGTSVDKAIDPQTGKVKSDEFRLTKEQNNLHLVCTNVVSKKNLMSLEIMKKLKTTTPEEGRLAEHTYGGNSFLVEVTIGGALYRNGAYSLYSTEDQGLTWTLVSGNLRTSSDGKLTIKPNEKAVITGLLGGTSFKVKEVGGDRFERFTPSYEISGGKNTSTTNGAEGLLNTASDTTNIKKVVVTINNKPVSTSIAINKIDSATSLRIGGATFAIYGDEALSDRLTEAISQPGTSLVISGLMVGETYYIKEVRAPEGYTGDDLVYKLEITSTNSKTITPGNVNGGKWSASGLPVTPTGDTDLTIKNHKLSLIRLIKKDNTDGYLVGVTFRLEKLNADDTIDGNPVEMVTGASGIVEFTNLLPGKYRITEIKTVPGYTLLTKPITIELPLQEGTAPKENATIRPYAEAEGGYYYDIVEYIITNSNNFTVPTTGGSNYFYVGLTGVALMTVALAGLIYRKKAYRRAN